ncbi:MAG: hypothetical protein D6767_00890 [Candidatus Hydrogenedentota bacterium]|nr:MAG: hypothetical protein D6767_00890 [Candidatus Hydrogenedentota bacterium]
MKKVTTAILLLGLISTISAGPIKDEYYKVENTLRNLKDTPEKRKAQLERTLVYSVRMAMKRLFNDQDWNKITIKDFQYERSDLNPHMYYIKYKTYIGYFVFPNSPEYYLVLPSEQKFLDKRKAQGQKPAKTKP